jgi:hypothetical protein
MVCPGTSSQVPTLFRPAYPDKRCGFQTSWREDAITSYVRGMPDNAVLYSDDPSLIYYATGRNPIAGPDLRAGGSNKADS